MGVFQEPEVGEDDGSQLYFFFSVFQSYVISSKNLPFAWVAIALSTTVTRPQADRFKNMIGINLMEASSVAICTQPILTSPGVGILCTMVEPSYPHPAHLGR